MALTDHELFGIYPAIFDALTIAHLSSVDPQHGAQKMVVTPGGTVDPAIVLEINRKPIVSITAHDLKAILDAVSPLIGLSVTSAWKAQYQQKQDGGTFTGANTHVLLSGTKGKLLVESISAQQDQQKPLDIMMKFYALWDGTSIDGGGEANPIAVSVAQNITGTPSVGGIYKLGPVLYEGQKLAGVQQSKVNFGVGYNTSSGDGEKAARIGTIDKRDPTFEVDVHNLSLVSSVGHGMKKANSGMTLYFRRVGYADSAPNHVSVTLGAGTYESTPAGTTDEGKVLTKLILTGAGTIATNTATALPA